MLNELYWGRILPFERRNRNAGACEIVRKIDGETAYFMDKLGPDDRQRFQLLSRLYSELDSAEEADLFAYGFSLGVLLIMDVMKEACTMAATPSEKRSGG